MTSKVFYYGRVSSVQQNEQRLLAAARECGVEERDIYIDKASGKDFNREKYQILKGQLRPLDQVIISSIDRLGRSYEMILAEWRSLIDLGVDIVVLDNSADIAVDNVVAGDIAVAHYVHYVCYVHCVCYEHMKMTI